MSYPITTCYLCQSRNVQAYFDGELGCAMNLLLEKHIFECGVCAEELRALQRLRKLVSLAMAGDFIGILDFGE